MEIREYKGNAEVRQGPNGPIITGYGIVFNSDSENLGGFIEQVDPRAVTKTLSESDIRGMAEHDSRYLLGRVKAGTMRLSTDSRGVRYEIDVNPNDPIAMGIYARVQRGDLDGSSFCFETLQESWDWEAVPARRRLLEINLLEMGPVTFPAYSESTAQSRVKEALKRIASKLGHPVERMAEALKSGEIRSLIDAPNPDEPDLGDEPLIAERVGKKLSATTLAALQRAVQELTDLMNGPDDGEDDVMNDNDADDYARSILETAIGEIRADIQPAPRPPDLETVTMDRARALARLREAEHFRLRHAA